MGRWMKRFLVIAAGLILLGFTLAFAAEKTPAAPPSPPRVPEMSTAGKVMEVTATILKIERTLKGEAETMEFLLEKPFTNIAVGDLIKVSYRERNGRNILIRVAPAKMTAVQKPKKEAPKAAKPIEAKAAPVAK
jgi:hypothetical protein